MLSVLIPTYNFDCTQLVQTLQAQLPEGAEIVVGDDCSTDEKVSAAMDRLSADEPKGTNIRIIKPHKNLGSAGMRNLLCHKAKGDYLLYIDCDAIINDSHFIEKYMKGMNGDVVCGTVIHPDAPPSPKQTLRWKYEKSLEAKYAANKRNEKPYQHFRTFHFMIRKEDMLRVPFDENIKRSGYEDLLFGKRLQEANINVRHTDICAVNGDIESNETFLRKTKGHIQTLLQLQDELKGYSTLLAVDTRLRKWHAAWIVRILFRISKPLLEVNLLSNHPSTKLFQFYKLGLFYTIPVQTP